MKKIVFALALFLSALLALPAAAHYGLMGDYDSASSTPVHGWGMMGGGYFGGWYWAGALIYLVWLLAGILLIVWLWQQITKK